MPLPYKALIRASDDNVCLISKSCLIDLSPKMAEYHWGVRGLKSTFRFGHADEVSEVRKLSLFELKGHVGLTANRFFGVKAKPLHIHLDKRHFRHVDGVCHRQVSIG